MTVTEKSGVFDTGTFDNARFDTVNQPSKASIQSVNSQTFNLTVSSFTYLFSDLGREITQDLNSYLQVNSVSTGQLQMLKTASSYIQVFNQADFRLGKKVVSTVQAFSTVDRTASLFRELTSYANVFSREKILPEFKVSNNVQAFSTVEFDRIFEKSVKSTINVFSRAVRVIPGFQWFIESSADVLKKIEGDAKTRFNIEGDAN